MPSTKMVELVRKYKSIGMSKGLFSRWVRPVEKGWYMPEDELEGRLDGWQQMEGD
jgi:hypothetical protein